LLTYVWFDRLFNLKSVGQDVVRRPFILVGMTAFFLMVPLAITSTNKMVKRLGGKRWARLHRLVYVAAVAGVVHFWMLVKSDTRLPLTFAFVVPTRISAVSEVPAGAATDGRQFVSTRMKAVTSFRITSDA
jgi:sulfoxide reductase heme-binding subunit YedZ